MPIFRVKSVKIYTGQKNLHGRRPRVRDKYEVWQRQVHKTENLCYIWHFLFLPLFQKKWKTLRSDLCSDMRSDKCQNTMNEAQPSTLQSFIILSFLPPLKIIPQCIGQWMSAIMNHKFALWMTFTYSCFGHFENCKVLFSPNICQIYLAHPIWACNSQILFYPAVKLEKYFLLVLMTSCWRRGCWAQFCKFYYIVLCIVL